MVIIAPSTDVQLIGELFREYADSLGVDLSFQDFENELASLPGDYDPILVARIDDAVAGCAALHALDENVAEMKRLYVRPAFRGRDIGRLLSERLIDIARERGFERLRLDTLPSMTTARALYSALGFREIEPYRFNPIEGTAFLELEL